MNEKVGCPHHWIITIQDYTFYKGRCKKCGMVKLFPVRPETGYRISNKPLSEKGMVENQPQNKDGGVVSPLIAVERTNIKEGNNYGFSDWGQRW